MPKRSIWTREGRAELNPIITRGRRREDLVTDYAEQKPAELRQPTVDVYLRAYMRAGLIPGDPDAIDTRLPAEQPAANPPSPAPEALAGTAQAASTQNPGTGQLAPNGAAPTPPKESP